MIAAMIRMMTMKWQACSINMRKKVFMRLLSSLGPSVQTAFLLIPAQALLQAGFKLFCNLLNRRAYHGVLLITSFLS